MNICRETIKKIMLRNPQKAVSNGYKLNAFAGIINACKSIILLVVVSRTNALHDAGILTISFALANLFVTIGNFGMRNYQVSDVKQTYSFPTYFSSRILTSLLMLFCVLGYLCFCIFVNGYTLEKAAVVLCIGVIFISESVENIFSGFYQQRGRLDVGSRLFFYRWLLIIILFSCILIFSKNLLLASFFAALMSMVCVLVFTKSTIRVFYQGHWYFDFSKILQLLKMCFPLFLSAFLSMYLAGAPKYAIDTYLTEEVQACYGFVSMPVFVTGLLASFIYQPQLVALSQDWAAGQKQKFVHRVRGHFLIILGISICCFVGAYVLGVPVLSTIYNIDLMPYKPVLLIIMIGSGFLALNNYLSILLIIMRKQKVLLAGNGIVAALALLFMGAAVQAHAALGASIYYLLLMVVLFILFFINTAISIGKAGIKENALA